MSPALVDAVRAQLAQDERLAWAATPEPRAFARKPRAGGMRDAALILGGGYAAIGSCVAALRTGR